MNLMERRNKSIKRRDKLEKLLAQQFERLCVNGNLCFRKQNGVVFSLCVFPKDAAIVVEYADTIDDAEKNLFEDGDLFYIEEMDEETMYQAVIQEIGQ